MKSAKYSLRKLTLLDFPGCVACTVFTGGCNFRCPFCHNASLVRGDAELEYDSDGIIGFLRSRVGILDGVCVTGGEPLLAMSTVELLAGVKSLGFSVKLDTNGSYPDRLKYVVGEGLVDYVALDIKNSQDKYDLTAGVPGMAGKVAESVEFLLGGKVDFEFRTTVVEQLHEPSDFRAIGRWISGAGRYFLQNFEDSGDILAAERKLRAMPPERMRDCLMAAREHIPAAEVRGIDLDKIEDKN